MKIGDVLDTPVRYGDGKRVLSARPGLGVAPVPERLQALAGDLDD